MVKAESIDDVGERKKETGPSSSNINNSFTMAMTIAEASSTFPGFRFSPTDQELIQYYLKKKLQGSDDSVGVISEVDICRHEPWDLPAHSVIQSDDEWFFFSPRGRKYPNGSQSKRATEFGYWKATGKERGVKSGSNVVGTKRTLVFHIGRAPKGQRTEWIMHEYCMSERSEDPMVVCRVRKNTEFHVSETTRGITRDEMNASTPINNTTISGGEQSGMVEGAKVTDSSSKECSSSYNSHSVEQLGSGSESDDHKVTNELSQPDDKATNELPQHDLSRHESSNLRKGSIEEDEDCYADIMKDDIIKLDDENPVAMTKWKSEVKLKQPTETTSSIHPFQGTANRRLRLQKYIRKPHEAKKFGLDNIHIEDIPIESDLQPDQRPKCLIEKHPSRVFLVFVLVVLIFLLFFSFSYTSSGKTTIFGDGSKFG